MIIRIGAVRESHFWTKNPAEVRHRWHLRMHCRSLGLTPTLVIHKEKRLVFLDRTTNRASELILPEDGFHVSKVLSRVEGGVAEKFKCASVETIRSRFSNNVDLPPAVVPIFGIE